VEHYHHQLRDGQRPCDAPPAMKRFASTGRPGPEGATRSPDEAARPCPAAVCVCHLARMGSQVRRAFHGSTDDAVRAMLGH
jgi:hypothetical protein